MDRTARALPVLLVLACTWGASFLFIKVVVEDTGPLEVVLGRMSFGLLAVALFMAFTGKRPQVTRRLVVQMSGMALLANVIPFGLIAWGEEHIPSGTASILNSTVPIFTAAIAAGVLTEERFTTARAGGLVLGFLGVAAALTLFLFLFLRVIRVATRASDSFASLVAFGLAGSWFVHVIINVGMTINLTPITGIPLPFFSYGGSFLLACWIAVGMLVRISSEGRGRAGELPLG